VTLDIGDRVPAYDLPDTDGHMHPVPDPGSPTVVVFTCNHCPYALAWHDRIVRAARDHAGRGVRFLAVNPNDGERYPADSYAAMQERVATEDWPLPYLHDATQALARAWGAKTTPDAFVVDASGYLVYRGAPDADHGDESQDAAWLRAAIDDLLAGRSIAQPYTEPKGCSVKWRA
jgi:hypothetical protein